MSEQPTTETTADAGVDRNALNNSFDHAMRTLLDAQREINNAGVPAPALASALCASYVTFVSAMVASIGLPKEEVLNTCKEALDTMDEFVNVAYDRMVKEIEEASK
jgi:hypothetical protein